MLLSYTWTPSSSGSRKRAPTAGCLADSEVAGHQIIGPAAATGPEWWHSTVLREVMDWGSNATTATSMPLCGCRSIG